jgi:hypothetical protein
MNDDNERRLQDKGNDRNAGQKETRQTVRELAGGAAVKVARALSRSPARWLGLLPVPCVIA